MGYKRVYKINPWAQEMGVCSAWCMVICGFACLVQDGDPIGLVGFLGGFLIYAIERPIGYFKDSIHGVNMSFGPYLFPTKGILHLIIAVVGLIGPPSTYFYAITAAVSGLQYLWASYRGERFDPDI